MALGLNFMRYPVAGMRTSRTWGEQLVEQAIPLNDYGTPTFTRASTAYDPYNRVTAISGARRRRLMPLSRTLSVNADLIEGAQTNLILRSQDLSNASWSKTDTTITSGALAAPDGTSTIDLCTEGSAGTSSVLQAVTITANRAISIGGYFKRGNTDWVLVRAVSGSDSLQGWFNLATGAKGTASVGGTSSGVTTTMAEEPAGSGLYRCTVNGLVSAAGTAVDLRTFSTAADNSFTRVNGATRYQGWCHVYQGPASSTGYFPSSYIPTVAATVTRAADALSVPYVLGQTGTILALCVPMWTGDQDGITVWKIWRADDTGPSRLERASSTALAFTRTDGGGAETGTATHGLTNATLSHQGAVWGPAAVGSYVNGVLGTQDTTLTPPFATNTLVQIGSDAGAAGFGGWLALLAWPRALSASELLAIYTAYPSAA